MTDVWSEVNQLDAATQDRLADVLETRGADPQHQAMRRSFLGDIEFPAEARVLEVGCGTGVLTRMLASWPGVGEVVGVDPAASLLARAERLADGLRHVVFQEADGRSLPFPGDSFDIVVFDSTLSHVSGPEQTLMEAHRVLKRPGRLAVFDGDYATMTVALGAHDPLQACVDTTMANSVHDRWVMRRLPAMVRRLGFATIALRSHGFVETGEGGYMLTVIDRGADMLVAQGQIDATMAEALKAEARRRHATGTFFGHVAYASLVAHKA